MPVVFRRRAVAHTIGDDVSEDGFAGRSRFASRRVSDWGSPHVVGQVLKRDGYARLTESGRGAAVGFQHLVAELIKSQTTTRGIAVHLIVSAHHDSHVSTNCDGRG
jgi:hypothetical protein